MKAFVAALITCTAMAQTRPNDEGVRRDQMDLVAVSLAATPSGTRSRASRSGSPSPSPTGPENNATGVGGVVLLAGKYSRPRPLPSMPWRGRKVVVPLTWTPPIAGAWELTALVDPDQRQVEENRADNVVSPGSGGGHRRRAEECRVLRLLDLDLVTVGGRTAIRARVQNNAGRPPLAALRWCSASGTA